MTKLTPNIRTISSHGEPWDGILALPDSRGWFPGAIPSFDHDGRLPAPGYC